jgi:hypothetical protein
LSFPPRRTALARRLAPVGALIRDARPARFRSQNLRIEDQR